MIEHKKALLLNTLYSPNVGGVENSLRALAGVLSRRGFDVVLVCSDRDYVTGTELGPYEKQGHLKVYRYCYPSGALGYFKQFANCCSLLRSLYKKEAEFDFVLSRNAITTIASFLAGVRRVRFLVPQVTLYKDASALRFRLSKVSKYILDVIIQFVAFLVADKNYVFSEAMVKQIFHSTMGLRSAVLTCPGVDEERFKPLPTSQKLALREKLGLPVDKNISLALGRFGEVKQFHLAIEAMAFLPASHFLILVGEGPEKEVYEKKIDDLGLHSSVKIFSATEYPEKYFKASDLFIMTSRYESFGQVLLEATAAGLPIVSFPPQSGVRTAIDSIYSGCPALVRYTQTASSTDLARKIGEHHDNDAAVFLEQRARFLRKYSWDRLVDDLLCE